MSKPVLTRWEAECQVRALQSLRSHLEGLVGDDEATIRDTIEGETDLDTLMEGLVRMRHEAVAMQAAHKQLAAAYADAAKADAARTERLEGLLFDALRAAEQPNWKGVAGSASVRAGSVSTEVFDATLVPLEYQDPKPSVSRIKEALQQGIDVPGARLIKGDPVIVVSMPSKQRGS